MGEYADYYGYRSDSDLEDDGGTFRDPPPGRSGEPRKITRTIHIRDIAFITYVFQIHTAAPPTALQISSLPNVSLHWSHRICPLRIEIESQVKEK